MTRHHPKKPKPSNTPPYRVEKLSVKPPAAAFAGFAAPEWWGLVGVPEVTLVVLGLLVWFATRPAREGSSAAVLALVSTSILMATATENPWFVLLPIGVALRCGAVRPDLTNPLSWTSSGVFWLYLGAFWAAQVDPAGAGLFIEVVGLVGALAGCRLLGSSVLDNPTWFFVGPGMVTFFVVIEAGLPA